MQFCLHILLLHHRGALELNLLQEGESMTLVYNMFLVDKRHIIDNASATSFDFPGVQGMVNQ